MHVEAKSLELAHTTSPARVVNRPRPLRRILIASIYILIALASLVYGIKLRHDVYDWSADMRFTRNIANAWLWGRAANADGLFHLYDDLGKGEQFPSFLPLDYPPLRLAIATAWVGYSQRHTNEQPPMWHPEYDYNAPMLWTDTLAALLASVMAFLLVRMWVRRANRVNTNDQAASYCGFRIADCGMNNPQSAIRNPQYLWQSLLAALLIWFNPAVLWNGYVWVQWDIWPVPFYLAAVLLGCTDWWFAAGASLAIGCCFKGQLLIAAPILFVWPLWGRRFGAMLRLIAGMAMTFTIIIFPWLNPSTFAITWFLQILVASALLVPIVLRQKISARSALTLSALAVLLAWPWTSSASIWLRMVAPMVLMLLVFSRYLRPRLLPHVYALAVAISIALMIPLFDASTGWYLRGFAFGAEHSQKMHDVGTYNVPALLQNLLEWPNDNRFVVAHIPHVGDLSMKTAAVVLYAVSLLLCGFFAARFERRRDARFLLAMFLPWLMLYMLLPQMFCRYLLWAGAIAGVLSGVGIGLTLLGVFISIITTIGMAQNQFEMVNYDRSALQKLQAVEPHLGWMLVLITLICLYCMCMPRWNSASDAPNR